MLGRVHSRSTFCHGHLYKFDCRAKCGVAGRSPSSCVVLCVPFAARPTQVGNFGTSSRKLEFINAPSSLCSLILIPTTQAHLADGARCRRLLAWGHCRSPHRCLGSRLRRWRLHRLCSMCMPTARWSGFRPTTNYMCMYAGDWLPMR